MTTLIKQKRTKESNLSSAQKMFNRLKNKLEKLEKKRIHEQELDQSQFLLRKAATCLAREMAALTACVNLINFESICAHIAEKFSKKDAQKSHFNNRMEFRKRSNLAKSSSPASRFFCHPLEDNE